MDDWSEPQHWGFDNAEGVGEQRQWFNPKVHQTCRDRQRSPAHRFAKKKSSSSGETDIAGGARTDKADAKFESESRHHSARRRTIKARSTLFVFAFLPKRMSDEVL
jgi:hypothetical protein